MKRFDFLLPIPPTTGAVVYRALVAGILHAQYPEVLASTASSFACRMEFLTAPGKQRDLDAMGASLLEALVKAGVLRDDSAIETLILSRSSDGPAGYVRVTLLELDEMTKAAVAKTFALEPWANKTLNSYPEGGGGGPGSTIFRNWPSMYVAWLQGNSTNGADVTAGRQAIAKTDVAVMQGAWLSKRATDYANITAIKAIRADIQLGPYLDPCFWKDTAESSTDDYTRSVYDVVQAGNSNWRLKDAAGTGLCHRFAPASFRATNMAVHIAGTSGGLRFSEALADRMELDLDDAGGDRRAVYSFWGFDDMTPVDYPKYSGGSDATPDYEADTVGDTTEDDTVPTGGGHKYRAGQAQFLTDFRAQFPTYAMFINTDLGLPYAQSGAACPVRPLTSLETYQAADACLVENVFSYRFRIADHETHTNDHVYPLKSGAGSTEGWMTLAANEVIARTDAQSAWGKKMYAVYQNMAVNSSTTPTTPDFNMARLMFAVCMSVEGAAYGAVMSGSDRPFWLDELAIDFGLAVGARSMGTLNDSAAPVTFTLRSADYTGGSSEKFYWTEYANALVVLRWDNVGITPGSANLGDGTAVACTLPSAGAGYQWDRFNAATPYVHPTHTDLAMVGQDTTLNSGATAVTSVSLKPYHAIFLKRSVAAGGGGSEVAPAFRSVTSGSTASSSVSTLTLSKPSGVVSGDLLVLAVQVNNNATAGSWGSVTWPSGFTEQAGIGADPGAWNKLLAATKVAGGSEPSTYDVTYGESGGPYRVIGAMLAYQSPNATPIDVAAVAQNNASNAAVAVAPSITPSNANEKRLVTIYGISDGNASTDARSLAPPGGQTERVEIVATTTAYSRLMVADEVYASASATGTRSAAISGGDCESQAISLLLRGKVP